jgi:tetratricopeptide (TPR) repeat protein
MKKILTLFCFVVVIQVSLAQNKYADSLQTVLVNTTRPVERFNLLTKILENQAFFRGGNIDSAECVRLLQIAQQLKNDSLLAASYNWIGSYFSFTKGDNATALEYYFKALPLAEKANDKRRLSSLDFDISLAYFALQNDNAAVKYVRKGGADLPDKSHPLYDFMLLQYQRGMARWYVKTQQPDSALYFGQAFYETSRRVNSIVQRFNALVSIADAYTQSGENELADVYIKKVISISDSVKMIPVKLRFSNYYIPVLLSKGNIPEATVQARQLLNLGELNNNNNVKLAATGFMRQIFDSLHNKDSAYYYSRMEATINAQIFSQHNINKIQSLAFNEQIRSIEEEAKQTEEEQRRKQNIQYALLALGIITFIIAFLLLSRRHITNTKLIQFLGVVALLLVFEFLNLLLHPFLERITNHSPVLMLLALVCIAALLVPLHHKLEKWATHKLVEKNKQVRLAAARKTIEQLEDKQTN